MGGLFDRVRAAVGPALAEIAAALGPLKPVWDSVSAAIGKAWDWVVKLLEPVNMTSEQLEGAASAGRTFGAVIGTVIAIGLRGFAALARVIGWIIGRAATVSSAVAKLPVIGLPLQLAQSVFSPTAAAAPAPGKPGSAPAAPRPGGMPAPARGRTAAAAPAAASRGGTTVTDRQTHTYQITQQRGESSAALAKRTEAERRRQAAANNRGRLVDAPG